jgi:hypothetical protein
MAHTHFGAINRIDAGRPSTVHPLVEALLRAIAETVAKASRFHDLAWNIQTKPLPEHHCSYLLAASRSHYRRMNAHRWCGLGNIPT